MKLIEYSSYPDVVHALLYANLVFFSARIHENLATQLKTPQAIQHERALAIQEYWQFLHAWMHHNMLSYDNHGEVIGSIEALIRQLGLPDSAALATQLHGAYFSNNGRPREVQLLAGSY